MGIHPGFMTRGLVLVHDAFGHGLVDSGLGFFKSRLRRIFIAGVNRLQHFLDRRAHKGTLAGVLPTMAL